MECISISHKTANSADRQRCYISKEDAARFLEEVMGLKQVEQCVVLSTCNRMEIYAQGEETCFKELKKVLAKEADADVEWVRGRVRRYHDEKAIRHLFQVVCGMESMVIGEDEILGQTRDAYLFSKERGYTGYELNSIFQAALACAKRVRTETVISRTAVSVATLAANEVFRLSLPRKTVLLIGSSGQMGGIILKNLLSQQNIRVIATVRSHNGIYQSNDARVENVDYQERYRYLDEADAVISATSSPHYTLTANRVREAIKTPGEHLFLDVSMPPDIDVDIAGVAGCRLVSLDDMQRLAQENNRRKQQALVDAEEILREDLEKIRKVLSFHRFAEAVPEWKERYGKYPAEKLLYLLRDEVDSVSFEAVLKVLMQR